MHMLSTAGKRIAHAEHRYSPVWVELIAKHCSGAGRRDRSWHGKVAESAREGEGTQTPTPCPLPRSYLVVSPSVQHVVRPQSYGMDLHPIVCSFDLHGSHMRADEDSACIERSFTPHPCALAWQHPPMYFCGTSVWRSLSEPERLPCMQLASAPAQSTTLH